MLSIYRERKKEEAGGHSNVDDDDDVCHSELHVLEPCFAGDC